MERIVSDQVVEDVFRQTDSGLFVPQEQSREREVWTTDEFRLVQRATRLLNKRGVILYMRCERDSCKGYPLEKIRGGDGGMILRCEHKDRVFYRYGL